VTAQYTPSFTASLALGLFGTLTSIVQSVTVGAPAQPSYQTQINLNAPSSVGSTDSFDLVADVSRTGSGSGGGVPTGTVTFSDVSSGSAVPLITDVSNPNASTVTLVNGHATLHVANGLAPGHYTIVASYQPDAADGFDRPSQSSSSSLQSSAPLDTRVATTTTVTVSPTTIAAGDTVLITATVTQSGAALGPSSGLVSFTSDSVYGTGAAVVT